MVRMPRFAAKSGAKTGVAALIALALFSTRNLHIKDHLKQQKFIQRLSDRGIMAVALLRLVPIAPFTVFNFIAGTAPLGWRQFFLGSLLGLVPGLGAITLFSDNLWRTITAPSPLNIAITVAAAGVLILFAWLARRWLRSA